MEMRSKIKPTLTLMLLEGLAPIHAYQGNELKI